MRTLSEALAGPGRIEATAAGKAGKRQLPARLAFETAFRVQEKEVPAEVPAARAPCLP